MLIMKIEVQIRKRILPEDRSEHNDYKRSFQAVSDTFYRNSGKKTYLFVSEIKNDRFTLGAFCKSDKILFNDVFDYLEIAGLSYSDHCETSMQEITFYSVLQLLRMADKNDFVQDDGDTLKLVGLDGLQNGRFSFDEEFCKTVTKDTVLKQTENLLCEELFVPEIERIFVGGNSETRPGHPVHYLIQTDDDDVRTKMTGLLVSALYSNKRVGHSRYTEIAFTDESSIGGGKTYGKLYRANFDGVMVVSYSAEDEADSEYASNGTNVITRICEAMLKYRNEVLTILCLPRSCEKNKRLFMEKLGAMTIVELREETVFGDKAKAYLRKLAKERRVKTDKALYKCVADSDKGCLASDLNREFDKWFDVKLRTQVYSQYAELETVNKKIATKKPRGSAYSELESMIGLFDAKSVINQALDFYKAQKLFREKGIATERPAMHMVFTGNPGTAKTTAARLFARIMKDNGLLSEGNLYEVGRADLVGKYVGWTANIVKEKFKNAKGSVLFIDEAYSLVDDKEGLFGDEAINTIVQEMENNREDMIVIFAGYPDKMEGFLQTNPGLRSRIAFHVPFADYSADELYQITQLLAKGKNIKLNNDVREKLIPIYESALQQSDFGNGRFARNLLEKAQMKLASRLVNSDDVDALTKEDVTTLIAEDFEVPAETSAKAGRKIGFAT